MRKTLWEKQLGSITLGAYEDDHGIVTVEGGVVFHCRTSYSRQAAEAGAMDLEEYSKQLVLRELKNAVDQLYNEMRS